MNKDITTKDTIKSIAKDIAKYILNLKIEGSITFVDKELQRIEKMEADIVALCKIDKKETILHIEIQNNNDANIPIRMLRYYCDIRSKFTDHTILQYLIYIGKQNISMKNFIKESFIEHNYNLVDMHEVDCQKLLRLDTPEALVLSILYDFKNKDELDIITYILKRLKELTKNDKHKFGKYMLVLETLSYNRDL